MKFFIIDIIDSKRLLGAIIFLKENHSKVIYKSVSRMRSQAACIIYMDIGVNVRGFWFKPKTSLVEGMRGFMAWHGMNRISDMS